MNAAGGAAGPVVLAFDTSQAWCAASLLLPGAAAPLTRVEPMARGQAEYLMVLLEEMLGGAGLDWRDLGLIGVGTGPGNFTGIRISVAAARGLALALGIPAIGVSAFAAAAPDHDLPYWVSIKAPRDQVYLQRFGATGAAPELAPAARLDGLDAPLVRADDIAPQQRVENIAHAAFQARRQPPARPAPLYVRAPDAAPPRNPAPAILP